MTERYVNENSNNPVPIQSSFSERSNSYSYDYGKTQFSTIKDTNRRPFVPNVNHIEIPNTGAKSVLKNSINRGTIPASADNDESFHHASEPTWKDDKFSTIDTINNYNGRPARPTIKNYLNSPEATHGAFTYTGTHSKSVTFEDTHVRDTKFDDTSINSKYIKHSYHDSPPESVKYMPDKSDEKVDGEIDMIDEKVKEGKEILQRLLNSTDSKSPVISKTFSRKEHYSFTDGAMSDSTCNGDRTSDLQTEPLIHPKDLKDPILASTIHPKDLKDPILASTIHNEDLKDPVCTPTIHSKDLKDPIFTSTIHTRDLTDPIFTSTRIEVSDERPVSVLGNEESLIRKRSKQVDVNDTASLVSEIKELKEELAKYQMNSFHEIKSMREDNEKAVAKLHGQSSSLSRQKETLEDYVIQLKSSLSKKNEKCSELQEQLHEKLTLIHHMSTTDNEECCKLENEVNGLLDRKKTLEEQIEKMEKSFEVQYNEIRELERRFQSEKQTHTNTLQKKDEEIAMLYKRMEFLSEENSVKEVEFKSEMETQVEKAVQRGKSLSQSHVNEMKLSLDNEVERLTRLESKHQVEVRHLKANLETFKAVNTKLKKDLEVCSQQNRQLEKNNLESVKKAREEGELEADVLRKKIIGFEKIQRSMALELIEESTKLAVVCGTSPSSSNMSSQDAFVDCNVMSEAMVVFKEHLEAFRHHVLSLSHDKQQQHISEISDDNMVPNINVQTSAKLLRHLQNRVQQLRKENAMLRDNTICESCRCDTRSNLNGNSLGNVSTEKQPVHLVDESNTSLVKETKEVSDYNHENSTESPVKNDHLSNEDIDLNNSGLNVINFNTIDGKIDL